MSESTMNALDEALAKYLRDESQQAAYYDLILNSDFYIPVDWQGVQNAGTEQEAVSPLVISSNDKHYMPLFDSEERLRAWAEGKPVEFIVLTGWRAALVSTPQLHWALNPGSGSGKEFVPEEIRWLKESYQAANG